MKGDGYRGLKDWVPLMLTLKRRLPANEPKFIYDKKRQINVLRQRGVDRAAILLPSALCNLKTVQEAGGAED